MKLHLLSDLHNEFQPFSPPAMGGDVVVLAGDTDRGVRGVAWAREAFGDTPVVYVAGNHEYYGHAVPRLDEKLQAAGLEHDVHVLENSSVVLHGVRFLGCTLWTDFALFGDPRQGMRDALDVMNDYRKVRVSPQYRRLRPLDTAARHRASVRWLQDTLQEPHDGPTVVVTHHAPTSRGLGPGWEDDPASVAYASRLDELVSTSGAELWVHGHSHYAHDTPARATRLVSNPRGYAPDDVTPGFAPDLQVEVGR